VAIVIVLLRQRYAQPASVPSFPPGFEQLLQLVGRANTATGATVQRSTAVADLASDGGLLDGMAASIGRQWQQEDENLRLQEASIVEELVSQNVNWARELAQT
jgi:hypothetical protein